jgi:predicted N-acyltransferase
VKLSTTDSLNNIPADAWNALAGDANPFVQHDFLLALETGDCLKPYGWQPHYLLAHDQEKLIGAAPAYIKTNSYGEFVFDWAWAEAYQKNKLAYYPKLVMAVPYSPVTGPRLLTREHDSITKQALVKFAIEQAQQLGLSSVHCLFNTADDHAAELDCGLMPRFDYQFHWQNQNYTSFEDFLSRLQSKKRKNILQERRKIKDAGIDIKILRGDELNEELWRAVCDFYHTTFDKKFGYATLNETFFRQIAHKLLVILAFHAGKPVAGAICVLGQDTLYGRHWGCYEDFDSLHFEVCYYRGIEYCIEHQLAHFEPGAQGEHKIARGFLPTRTCSAHWIAHEGFRHAIADFLHREARALEHYGEQLMAASPYKTEPDVHR